MRLTANTINDAVTMAGNGEGALLANRYRIVRQLGAGGMGSVWLAEDTQLDNKPFAIKMLPAILVSNKRAYRQLKDEALVAMRLVHPNIVQIRAFEENNGNPFLVMDYVDGETLDDYLAEHSPADATPADVARPPRPCCKGEGALATSPGTTSGPSCGGLPEADVLRILKPIAAALDYAHSKGVVHRDVKPGNVMIAKDGTPYILDFGIAREIQETLTRVTGKLSSGTLLYMSPEQLNGDMPKKEQDIYSFAAMAYECLKGEPPFVRGAIEDQIKNKQPEPLVGHVVLSAPLAAGIMAGLAKKPENRPKSCGAVLFPVFAVRSHKVSGNWQTRGPAKRIAITTPFQEKITSPCADHEVATMSANGVSTDGRISSSRNTSPTQRIGGRLGHGGAWKHLFVFALLGLVVVGGGVWYYQQRQKHERTVAGSIRHKAYELKSKVEHISDDEDLKERKEELTNTFARAESLFNERTQQWSTAAQEFSNYVTKCELLIKLNDELQKKKQAIQTAYSLFAAGRYEELLQEDSVFSDVLYLQGRVLTHGLAGTFDLAGAFQKFEAAAKEGHALAMVSLGMKYCNGVYVKKDLKRGVDIIEKRKKEVENLAKAGNPYAQDILADLYYYGWGYESNKTIAAQWYKRASDQGDVVAMTGYGERLLYGIGIETNTLAGIELLEKANRKGSIESAFLLGYYWYGRDRAKAEFWFKRCEPGALSAAEQDALGAQFWAGFINENGLAGKTNDIEAIKWYTKAADQGHANAQNRLGLMYWNGKGVSTNCEIAVTWFRKAAEQGFAVAQLNMGKAYQEGNGVGKNIDEAVKWYCKAAEQGLADAQNLLGIVYENNKWGRRDLDRALHYYTKAAEQGLAAAQFNLGLMYWDGKGVRTNDLTAVTWFRKAAEQGRADAQNWLGLAYEAGRGVGKDLSEALQYYNKAAEQGFAAAQFNLGFMYWEGRGVSTNRPLAVTWFRKAAEQGSAAAQNMMGRACEDGNGVEKDPTEALQYYNKAAEQGLAVAQFNLGIMYWDGKGVRKNRPLAVTWFRKAAEQGSAVAQNMMGRAYEDGIGVEKDLYEAVKWFERAAAQELPLAQFNLGLMYWNGEGVSKNRPIAVIWCRKAAEYGQADAQYFMGNAYRNGIGVEKNCGEALLWFKRAADQGHKVAQNTLGKMHWEGEGVMPDHWTAVNYFRKAAEQGLPVAQWNLGWAYESGKGVAKDVNEAVRWYRRAASQGYEGAKEKLRRLEGVSEAPSRKEPYKRLYTYEVRLRPYILNGGQRQYVKAGVSIFDAIKLKFHNAVVDGFSEVIIGSDTYYEDLFFVELHYRSYRCRKAVRLKRSATPFYEVELK